VPPPDVGVTIKATAEELRSAGRVDLPHGALAEESFRAQLEGRAPILPTGQPAW
jgi:hypothetical protein